MLQGQCPKEGVSKEGPTVETPRGASPERHGGSARCPRTRCGRSDRPLRLGDAPRGVSTVDLRRNATFEAPSNSGSRCRHEVGLRPERAALPQPRASPWVGDGDPIPRPERPRWGGRQRRSPPREAGVHRPILRQRGSGARQPPRIPGIRLSGRTGRLSTPLSGAEIRVSRISTRAVRVESGLPAFRRG